MPYSCQYLFIIDRWQSPAGENRQVFHCPGPGRSTGCPALSPHRPGLEDFPHPVPRFRFFHQTINHPGDTPSGARLCCLSGFKYYGLSSARVADRSFEESQRARYPSDSFGSTICAKPSPCIRRQPPMPCSCR